MRSPSFSRQGLSRTTTNSPRAGGECGLVETVLQKLRVGTPTECFYCVFNGVKFVRFGVAIDAVHFQMAVQMRHCGGADVELRGFWGISGICPVDRIYTVRIFVTTKIFLTRLGYESDPNPAYSTLFEELVIDLQWTPEGVDRQKTPQWLWFCLVEVFAWSSYRDAEFR